MPTKTFDNLTAEKKTKILDAAAVEFSNYSLQQSKVSRIIQTAQIPRGSFYQYFESLDDLFMYVVKQLMEKRVAKSLELAANSIDVFNYTKLIFEFELHDPIRKKHKNIVKSFNQLVHLEEKYQKELHSYFNHFKEKLISILHFDEGYSKEEKDYILKMCQNIKGSYIRESIINDISKEEIKEKFIKELTFFEQLVRG